MTLLIVKYSSYIWTRAANIGKIGFAGILISIFFSSCNKDLPACRGNCDLVTFSGDVAEFTSGQPIGNQTIKVILKQNTYCLLCSTYNVASGNSDANGHFEFKKNMDTSLLQDYHIEVELTTSDKYITRIAPADSSVGYLYPRTTLFSFWNINSSLNNIQFRIYSKTSLRLNLHRNTVIISGREYVDLQYYFGGGERSGATFVMNGANIDTAVFVNTAANVFTKITSSKFITADSVASKTDSIKCGVNTRNAIDISY